jgi:hypothetical protein
VATHRFLCPSCGKRLKVDDAMLADARRRNRGAHCPTCRAPLCLDGLGEPPPSWEQFAVGDTGASDPVPRPPAPIFDHNRGPDADGIRLGPPLSGPNSPGCPPGE